MDDMTFSCERELKFVIFFCCFVVLLLSDEILLLVEHVIALACL